MERNVPTSAWVIWAPLVAGGGPRQAEPVEGCSSSLICEASCWRLSRMILSNCDMSSYYIEFYNEMGSKLLCHHLTVCLDSEELLSLTGTDLKIFLSEQYFCICGGWILMEIKTGRITLIADTLEKFFHKNIFLFFQDSLCIWLRPSLEWL